MSYFDQCHTPEFGSDELAIPSRDSGNTGEMPLSASSGHPMTLSECLFVVGLFVLALVFSYFVVFRIDPFAAGLYRATPHAIAFAEASQGESR
jgi:hypothetical protein